MTEQLIYIAVMAVITYLIRVLPITVFRKEITSQWLMSFLHYVPYAVLAALTFPAIFTATGNVVTSTAGTLVALVLAYFDCGSWGSGRRIACRYFLMNRGKTNEKTNFYNVSDSAFVYDWWRNGLSGKTTAVFLFYAVV